MPQFLPIANRTLLIVYLIVFLPLFVCVLSGRSFPLVDRTPWKRFVDRERERVVERSKIMTLNLYKPSNFKILYQFAERSTKADAAVLGAHILYFKELAEVLPVPLNADAYAMLGFCYFHQGKTDEALLNYARSLEGNPVFLSTYFNLALVYFRAGNYSQASELISRMMAMTPELTLRIIAASKIYTDILRDGSGLDPSVEIKKTYADAMRLLVISLYRQGRSQEVLNAAQYAVASGIGPVEFFQYYAALSMAGQDDGLKAQVQTREGFFTAEDITARLF